MAIIERITRFWKCAKGSGERTVPAKEIQEVIYSIREDMWCYPGEEVPKYAIEEYVDWLKDILAKAE